MERREGREREEKRERRKRRERREKGCRIPLQNTIDISIGKSEKLSARAFY